MKMQASQGGNRVNICPGEWRQEFQVMSVVATQVWGWVELMSMMTWRQLVEIKKRYSNL